MLEGKKGRYLDINSLYPFVQKYRKYPVGDASFLSGSEVLQDIDLYFGTASVKVLNDVEVSSKNNLLSIIIFHLTC